VGQFRKKRTKKKKDPPLRAAALEQWKKLRFHEFESRVDDRTFSVLADQHGRTGANFPQDSWGVIVGKKLI
jgi:hypothetical protein